ncbi:MAG: methyltransferase domain-containing protein [Vicinamibacterales bacterium]
MTEHRATVSGRGRELIPLYIPAFLVAGALRCLDALQTSHVDGRLETGWVDASWAPRYWGRRYLSTRYLKGNGLELGPLHRPLMVSSRARVRYVDRLPVEALRAQYPELADHALVPLDVIDDGERLNMIGDASLDFIIANHFLEHCEDPIGAMLNHLRKLRPGGVLYYAIPLREHTFDRSRELTSLTHLMNDYADGGAASRLGHFEDWVSHVEGEHNATKGRERARQLLDGGYSIHFHVWNRDTFLELIEAVRGMAEVPFRIEYALNWPLFRSEFVAVLRRATP